MMPLVTQARLHSELRPRQVQLPSLAGQQGCTGSRVLWLLLLQHQAQEQMLP